MSDKLDTYRRKRDPRRTPEPVPADGPLPRGRDDTFVIQEHHARRLHWDFRLERDGVLVSWALPKGVPDDPARNHLAVHTEDHPLDYASFAGEIPAGEYGGGSVTIWDRGTYELLEEKRDGGLTVRLAGERLEGVWALVPAKLSGDEKNTIFQVNMEAAVEIARQIRLRNIGGLVILDFIDMKERRHRQSVYDKMVELMSEDKAKTHILPISQLGIMQMTRQRQQESLSANLYTGCPYCHGRGTVKSATTMSVELQRRLSSVARRLQARKDNKEYSLRVHVHPSILERLRAEDADLLVRMEKTYGVKLAFRADPNYHVENFKIINAINNEEYR